MSSPQGFFALWALGGLVDSGPGNRVGMADETLQHDTTLATPVAVPASPQVIERPVTESQFTESEVAELRRRLADDSGDGGGNRFGWFLMGFLAALLSITVAAVVFLAVSDRDDDGNINIDVPAVDVEG